MQENNIDPKTGQIMPSPEGEVLDCSAEATRLRKILGGGSTAGLGQAAREVEAGWIGRYKWWMVGLLLAYMVVSRMVLGTANSDDL